MDFKHFFEYQILESPDFKRFWYLDVQNLDRCGFGICISTPFIKREPCLCQFFGHQII